MITHTTGGGAEQTLIHLHTQLIRFKLDYGTMQYYSVRP